MIFNNNQKVYVKVKSVIFADYDAPYSDGSCYDKKSIHYKNTVKENKKNYEFLRKYIESGEKLQVSYMSFPDRKGSTLDGIDFLRIGVYDKKVCKLYTFNTVPNENEMACANHERYVCEFFIE